MTPQELIEVNRAMAAQRANRRIATVSDIMDTGGNPFPRVVANRAKGNARMATKADLKTLGSDCTGGGGRSSPAKALPGASQGVSFPMMNRAATSVLTPGERELLKKDKAAHEERKFRHGDEDCGAAPIYNPHTSFAAAQFKKAIQQYIDQGMSYEDAWMEARKSNPATYSIYTTHSR